MYSHYSAVVRSIFGESADTQFLSIRNKGDYVVLVPGVVGGVASMRVVAKSLQEKGYQVLIFDCSMRKYPIQVIATRFLHNFVLRYCLDSKKRIHFVTHSIGGIVLRKFLQDHHSLNTGKIVMLAPPNHGAEMAGFFDNILLRRFFLGVPGKQISTDKKAYVHSLKQELGYEVGVISGCRSANPFSYFNIKGKNDGFVSVESTKLQGMKDHAVLQASHHGMLVDKKAVKHILSFLQREEFF